jgi:hypothetical protein
LQPTKEGKEVFVEKKVEDLILLFEEIPSFIKEEEEGEKVVPSLKKQVMAFDPLPKNEDLPQPEQEENHSL